MKGVSKKETMSVVNTTEILKGFADMLTRHQEASEERQAKSDAKIEARQTKSDEKMDTLVDAIHTLTLNGLESRKDKEQINSSLGRLDDNQKEQGKELKEQGKDIKALSNQMIIVKERQGVVMKSTINWPDVAHKVITAAILLIFLTYFGLK